MCFIKVARNRIPLFDPGHQSWAEIVRPGPHRLRPSSGSEPPPDKSPGRAERPCPIDGATPAASSCRLRAGTVLCSLFGHRMGSAMFARIRSLL